MNITKKMNITNAQYCKRHEIVCSIKATIDGISCSVPIAPDNRHYIEILKQVDEGTITIAEAD